MLMLVACGSSDAAPFTWDASGGSPLDDGGGNWNATGGTNWFNGTTYGAWGNTNADTATFGVNNGTAGTITVGSVTANGITFNTAGSGNYTLSSGTITMAGTTPTITVNASGTTTLTSVLAGSAGLTKTGTGTLLLGTGNTYTGTTTITQGIVQVTSINNTLGTGNGQSVRLNGGAIEVTTGTAGFAPLWTIAIGANGGTLLNTSGYAWSLRNNLGGSGTVALRGSFSMAASQNSFSGKWVIDGAFIDQAQSPWGAATGDDVITLVNNGTLFSRGGTLASATQGITISSGTGNFLNAQFAGAATTIPAKLSGAGAARFTPTNGAIITLTNTSNSYAGDTLVSGTTTNRGFLRIGASEVVPDGAGKGNVVIFNNGAPASLNLNGFNETINGLSSLSPLTSTHSTDSQVDNLLVSSTSTLTVGGNDASQTFAGVIQNSLSGSGAIVALTKIGSGTQTLSGANTYWGPTSINGGALELGAGGTAGSLSGSSSVTIASGGSLAFRRSNSYGNFANAVSGAGDVVVTSGTVTFTGSNSYAGSTRVNGGVLVAGVANAFGASTAPLVINAGTASLGGFSVAVGPLSGSSGGVLSTSSAAGTATFTTDVGSGTSTFAGSIANNGSGVVALTKQGGGTLVLSGNNTYTGTTTIAGGAIQVSAISNSLGSGASGAVRLDGGSIVLATTSAVYPTWAISVGAGGGSLMGSGSGGLWGVSSNTISGSGTLTLQSSDSFQRFQFGVGITQTGFSGKWVVDGSGGAFVDNPQGSPWGVGTGDDLITLVNNGTLLMRSGTVGSATQGITIGGGGATLNGAGNVTTVVAAKISSTGTASVTFAPSGNTGIVQLTNTANSYAGDTVVAGKTAATTPWFQLGAAGVIPDGSGKGNVVIINSGARGAFDLNGFSETINGLSSFNGSSFATDSIVDNLAAGTTSTLTLGGNDASQTFSGTIQNSNSGSNAIVALTKIGSGTQTLSGANTYWGATNINAGTLRIGAGSTTGALSGSSAISGSAGATLAFERSNTVTQGTHFASVIGGAINLSQLGSGTLVLNGANTFSGTTRAIAGTLSLNATNALQNSTLDLSSADAGSVLFGLTGTNTYNIGGLIGSRNLATSGSVVLSVGGNGSNGTYSGTISGGGAFTKVGAGTLTLSAANTYTGQTRVSTGVLALGAANVISNQSNLLVDGGGFNLAGFSETVSTVTITSGSIFGDGTLAGSSYALQGGTLESILGSGPITVSTGTTTLGSASRFNSASGLTISSGQLTLGGSESVASFVLSGGVLAGTGNTLTSAATYDVQAGIVSANLGGSVGLTKSTAGTVTLLGANGFSGNTTISGGTLALGLNGSFNSSPTITVGNAGSSGAVLDLTAKTSGFTFGSGQTLKGIGTIQMAAGQPLTLNGTLAAGNSPGTLTIAGGDLVLGGSSVTQYEISGTDNTVGGGINDLTRVAGSLTLGGTLSVTATPAFDLFGSRTYRVFDYATGGSGSLAGSMTVGATPDANYLYSLNTATLGQVNLFVQRKAEQSAALAYSQPTSGTVNAFTNTNVSFSGTLANLSPAGGAGLTVSLAGNGGQLTVGSLAAASGSSVAAGSSTAVTGQIATGTSLGARTWSVVNTDSGAIGSQTSTANGVVNVFAHGTPTLSGTTIDFGYVLVGTSTSRSLTVSNGTLGSPASNTGGIMWTSGTLPGGFTGGGASSAGVIASGGGATYSFTLATGSAGGPGGSQTFSFADDSSILGSGSLGSQSVSLTGTVLDPATAILSGGITSGTTWLINLGEHNQGAGVYTQGFSISNLLQTLGYTADLELLSFASDPANTGDIGITLSGTSFGTLPPGLTNSYQASLSLNATGGFANVYNLSFGSSKNGASLGGTPQNVQLTVTGVIVVPEPGAVVLAGVGIALSVWVARRRRP